LNRQERNNKKAQEKISSEIIHGEENIHPIRIRGGEGMNRKEKNNIKVTEEKKEEERIQPMRIRGGDGREENSRRTLTDKTEAGQELAETKRKVMIDNLPFGHI
jgi:hypothetical protein